jgi:quinol monooxygenase YgiN
MITLTAKNFIKADKVDEFIELTKPLIEKSRKEEGCIEYGLYRDSSKSNVLTFIERWESEKALDLHGKTEHYTSIVPKLRDLAEAPGDLNLYTKVQ